MSSGTRCAALLVEVQTPALHASVARAQPGLQLDGVLVEAMSPRGLELVVGARRECHAAAP